MMEIITPFLDELALIAVSLVLGAVGYAKIAVKNVDGDEAQRIALKVVTALADGSMSAQEKQDIVADIIKSMRTK